MNQHKTKIIDIVVRSPGGKTETKDQIIERQAKRIRYLEERLAWSEHELAKVKELYLS